MTQPTQLVQGIRPLYVSVTIPANAGTAVTLLSLVSSSIPTGWSIVGAKVCKQINSGGTATDRSAFIAGNSTSSLPRTVDAGVELDVPCTEVLAYTFVKAITGAAITAVIEAYLVVK